MSRRLVVAAAALAALPLLATACGGGSAATEETSPAVIVHLKGSDVVQVRLTSEAAEHIGVRTASVRSDGTGGLRVIPYRALLYDPDGKTWTYTNPKPLVFQRANIHVARIAGASVVLTKGPPVGTRVVTEGATEIWGVEYGGIKED